MTFRTVVLAGALAAVVATAACGAGTAGEAGRLVFEDRTKGPSLTVAGPAFRAVAVGAELRLRVAAAGQAVRPEAAQVAPTGVFDVVALADDGVRLRARAAGTVTIHVRAGGVEDSLPLRAAGIEETRVQLYPLGYLAAEGVLGETGIVLLPGARLWGFVEHRAGGAALTGHGAAACTADAGARVTTDPDGDLFTLVAPEGEGAVRLACGAARVELPVVSADVATRLGAYDFFTGRVGPRFPDAETGLTKWIVVTAFDAQGRLVQGTAGEAPVVTVPSEDAAGVVVEDASATPAVADLLRDNRAFGLRFTEPGEYTVDVSWHGLSSTVAFTVVAGG